MLRYQPPKSNIWGHSLRKMKPSKERAAADEFEKKTVAKSVLGASSLWIARVLADKAIGAELIQQFETALGKESKEGYFHIVEAEFETAFGVLVSLEDELPDLKAHVLLSRRVKVQEWLIDGVAVPTASTLSWDFGTRPGVSTFLQFNDRREFDFIAAAFEELKICRLNEKHLKPVRRAK